MPNLTNETKMKIHLHFFFSRILYLHNYVQLARSKETYSFTVKTYNYFIKQFSLQKKFYNLYSSLYLMSQKSLSVHLILVLIPKIMPDKIFQSSPLFFLPPSTNLVIYFFLFLMTQLYTLNAFHKIIIPVKIKITY